MALTLSPHTTSQYYLSIWGEFARAVSPRRNQWISPELVTCSTIGASAPDFLNLKDGKLRLSQIDSRHTIRGRLVASLRPIDYI